eukprot:scaffold12788_cov19-Tisochrysis_lutea.AAC.1
MQAAESVLGEVQEDTHTHAVSRECISSPLMQAVWYVHHMQAVESVLGEVQEDRVTERPSSGGQYLSVKIGPVVVMNPDQ